MRTADLIDEQWQQLGPLLPARQKRGRPRANERKTLNGILYVLRTGCRWADVPREYGSPATCWRRLRAWDKAFLDGSFVPATKGGAAVGKTKRGKGTKLMLVTDGNGLPIGFYLESANHHEVKLAVPTLETVRVPRRRRGRSKQRPKELVADKAYDSKGFRSWCGLGGSSRRSRFTSGVRGSVPGEDAR